MADDVVDGSRLPDDVLVQILSLIPASSRRPLHVVCKRWRNVIDERTPPEEKLPAKILVFVNQDRSSSAIVFDNASSHRRHHWTYTYWLAVLGTNSRACELVSVGGSTYWLAKSSSQVMASGTSASRLWTCRRQWCPPPRLLRAEAPGGV